MTRRYAKFDFSDRDGKIVHLWMIDGHEVIKLVHYDDDEPEEWHSEWGLEMQEIDCLMDTKTLIRYVGDIKTAIKSIQDIILRDAKKWDENEG